MRTKPDESKREKRRYSRKKHLLTAINAPSVVDIPASVDNVKACFSPGVRWRKERERGMIPVSEEREESEERKRGSDESDAAAAADGEATAMFSRSLFLPLLFLLVQQPR